MPTKSIPTDSDALFQNIVTMFFQPLLQFATVVAFLYFLYGGVIFMMGVNDTEKREKGKRHLLWGTFGLFIIVSIGGILRLLNTAVGGMF
jgi:hypothetical protein